MATQVIVVESDPQKADEIAAVLKKSPKFEIAATYHDANAAIRQSTMFNPELFLINGDDEENLPLIYAFIDTYPNAKVFGLMEIWHSKIADEFFKAGADGCILKSFTIDDLEKFTKLYEERGKRLPARIMSFFSPKGRAGRTTIATILGLELAEKSNERVALIDADLQFGDMPIFFDVVPKQTIVDAAQDIKLLNPLTFDTYFHPIKKGVSLLASPERPEYAELVDAENLVEVVKMASNLCRYVIVDLPVGFNPLSISMCEMSDTNFIVSMFNTKFDILHMRHALEMLHTWKKPDQKLYTVFTRVNPCDEENRLKIQDELGYPVTDIIPNEYQMISIANSGRLSKGLPMDSFLMKGIAKLADDIIEDRR